MCNARVSRCYGTSYFLTFYAIAQWHHTPSGISPHYREFFITFTRQHDRDEATMPKRLAGILANVNTTNSHANTTSTPFTSNTLARQALWQH